MTAYVEVPDILKDFIMENYGEWVHDMMMQALYYSYTKDTIAELFDSDPRIWLTYFPYRSCAVDDGLLIEIWKQWREHAEAMESL